jgi:hypothetical protein
MGMTSNERDVIAYLEMRRSGESHEECVRYFNKVGIDIEHILSLSPMQLHFGENWMRNTLVIGAVMLIIAGISHLIYS